MFKKILIASVIGASFASVPFAAAARTIVITEAPPPAPRQESMPEMRRGHEWAPGHYAWRNGKYVWVQGHFMRERRGMHWVADRWVEHNGRWTMVAGHWQRGNGNRGMRDRDGDGVPNRMDARPNNPNRS